MISVSGGVLKRLRTAYVSAVRIFWLYNMYRGKDDFVGMDMARKFLEMGFTRARRYANHKDGKKYDKDGNVRPQEKIGQQVTKQSQHRYLKKQDRVTTDPIYI